MKRMTAQLMGLSLVVLGLAIMPLLNEPLASTALQAPTVAGWD